MTDMRVFTGQDPMVSIIVNNYNYGQFLADAIDSALAQTYPNCEVIVVDDGSTDISPHIIASYGSEILAIRKSNGGQASALNAGFRASQGDVVIFLDADDVLLPETAGRVADALRAHPDAAKVMVRMEVIDSAGRRTGTLKPPSHLPLLSGDLRRYELTFPFDMTWMATSGNAFAAGVLRRIMPIPESDFKTAPDYYLSHLAPLFGPVVFLQDVGAGYRVHGSNSHEVTELSLRQVRQKIQYMRATHAAIRQFAEWLGLRAASGPDGEGLSVSYVAGRLVSYKLDPEQHPIAGDNLRRLFQSGVSASLRRFDVPLPLRLVFVAWFAAMVAAPRSLAQTLAEAFFFPDKRFNLNKLLGALHGIRRPSYPTARSAE